MQYREETDLIRKRGIDNLSIPLFNQLLEMTIFQNMYMHL